MLDVNQLYIAEALRSSNLSEILTMSIDQQKFARRNKVTLYQRLGPKTGGFCSVD
jgi:hypothetical protein